MANLLQNNRKKFYCDLCSFEADKQKDYNRHLDTFKHIKNKEREEQKQKDKKEMLDKHNEEKRKETAER
jgi:hypothetical protein